MGQQNSAFMCISPSKGKGTIPASGGRKNVGHGQDPAVTRRVGRRERTFALLSLELPGDASLAMWSVLGRARARLGMQKQRPLQGLEYGSVLAPSASRED